MWKSPDGDLQPGAVPDHLVSTNKSSVKTIAVMIDREMGLKEILMFKAHADMDLTILDSSAFTLPRACPSFAIPRPYSCAHSLFPSWSLDGCTAGPWFSLLLCVLPLRLADTPKD